MTYCVGLMLEAGMVLLSDTRTNAGLDNIATYRKMFHFERPGERIITVLTAGSLSVTQTTLLLVAGSGESMRRRVPSPEAARDFAGKKLKLPVYDVNLVGLPPRKREWDLRQAGASSKASTLLPRPRSGAAKIARYWLRSTGSSSRVICSSPFS